MAILPLFPNANSGLEENITAIEGNITTIEGNITAIEGNITTIEEDITTIEGNITAIEEDIIAIEEKISSLPYYLSLKDISTNDDVKLYIENGELKIRVPYYATEADLIDFTYTANADNTYTLTGWKGTTNGVSGTEIIIPEADNIIL